MSVFALTNEYVELNGVDMSDHAKQGTLALSAAQLDPTAFGDGWVKALGGLKSGTLTIELMDDYDASEVDATLWPIFGTVVPFVVRPDAGAASPTNPEYSGEVLITTHSVGGSVGELAMKSGLSFPTSGVVSRATA
ncbi:hypothetical protein E1295_31870 [Nonomuraea mesophila]|uniref:Phage tail protein n=1 Tax=Nonomuraea mesophila TaxID=2530382 RepID=A0A4R5EZG6_9ACTN|nr:hypothetical protein [Nonomuraea mesophila]TDE40499.1 hypothetical protein E1295_31870 [Nonomuraea mesophila]